MIDLNECRRVVINLNVFWRAVIACGCVMNVCGCVVIDLSVCGCVMVN